MTRQFAIGDAADAYRLLDNRQSMQSRLSLLIPETSESANRLEVWICIHSAVRRDFIARHFLIGGDWGPENFPNSHHYVLELQLQAAELDGHGYLVDIVEVSNHLDELIAYYGEKMLNDLPEFEGLNPEP